MPLPLAQSRVLRYLASAGPATAAGVTAGLRMDRPGVQNALTLLTAKGLAVADAFDCPVSYTVTAEGREALAEGGES
jgi:DNA-binding MarR family transcriptional regulator